MGDSFQSRIREDWQWPESSVATDMQLLLENGSGIHYYAFEEDDPPIPIAIQQNYESIIDAAASDGFKVTRQIIPGVKHSFRKTGTSLEVTIPDEESIIRTAKNMANLILENG